MSGPASLSVIIMSCNVLSCIFSAPLHSSNEPGELSQWLCHDDSTINIVVLIIIIIIIKASHLQELSYRQQIARQLRTQYAEGIYRHKYYTVTLKSRLRVTQGHWKRNH